MKYRSLVAKRLQLKSNNRSKVRVSAIAVSTILLSEVILGNISGLIPVAEAAAPPVNLCYKTGTELDLDQAFNVNTRAKLTNPAYFGVGGTAAPETFNFISISTITASALSSNNCQIYFGGGSITGDGTDDLTLTEISNISTWVQTSGRFILAGCDYTTANQICSAFRSRTNIANGGVTINSALSYNPLTCGGALSVATFGGVSSYFTTESGDSVLATHTVGGQPAAITDDLVTAKFLFTGDADMYGNAGSNTIGTGGTATSDQAKLIVNSFKFALDAIMGRLSEPQCFSSYDLKSDLELGITTSNATPSLNGQTTLTATVFNRGPNDVTDVAADIVLPAGLSLDSQTGTGSYSTANRTWTIGSLPTNTTATITLTLDVNNTGSYSIPAKIIRSSLADVDSATNTGFGVDDLSDGIADDDEATVTITSVLDFGDAPNSYGTTLASNGARHSISGGIYLGAVAPDAEADAASPLNGTGDGPQDDGVTFPSSITQGGTISIPVIVTGAGALNAWIDWDGNGSFGAGEQIAADAIDGGAGDTDNTANGTITLSASVPSGATVGASYARFRYSSQTGLAATGLANNGEVEDYVVAIAAFVSNPNMILVKRVTAIASNAITGFFDDVGTDDDTDPQWPVNYIQGSVDTSTVQPGQEIEYTIYFLSNGNVDLTDINICDHIPANTTYVDNSAELVFGSDGAIPLNNARDTDEGEYFAPNTSILATDVPDVGICRSDRDPSQDFPAAENTNGALWVEVDKNTTPIPVGQAGYVRFRVTVNQTSIP